MGLRDMTTVEENMQALSTAILGEAQAEAEQIHAEGSAKAEAILKRAQEQADAESKEITGRAAVEADRIRSQVIATTQLKARTLELEHREKLLDSVFTAVRQGLSAQPKEDGGQTSVQLLREALAQLKAPKAIVRADPATQQQLTGQVLEDLSKEMKTELVLGKPLEQGTGVTVETEDGHLKFDNTLETRLSRLQSGLRSSVYRLLMGE